MPFPLWKRQLGQLAQLVEHRPYKAGATGSSPVLPTKEIKAGFLPPFLRSSRYRWLIMNPALGPQLNDTQSRFVWLDSPFAGTVRRFQSQAHMMRGICPQADSSAELL